VAALQADSWFGVIAPRAAPPAALDRLHDAFAQVAAMPEVQARLRALGLIPAPMTRAEWGTFYTTQVEQWSAVPRRANMRID
jgi:tripartite-type tricarboxylate transporter receptor subunit TctC